MEANKSNYAGRLVDANHGFTYFKTNLEPLHVCKKGRYINVVVVFTKFTKDLRQQTL